MPSAPTTSDAPIVLPSCSVSCARSAATTSSRNSRRCHDVDPGAACKRQQRGAQCTLLDDPCECALSEIERREFEQRAAIAFDAHRFDRRDARALERLPCAERVEQRSAAGTYRVDARIPIVVRRRRLRRRKRRAIDDRHPQPGVRQRNREREADEACPGDDDIAIGRGARLFAVWIRARSSLEHRAMVPCGPARVRQRPLVRVHASASSDSIVSCWLV